MDKSRFGTIKPSNVCILLKMDIMITLPQLSSTLIFQLSSQLEKMTSSTFGTLLPTEMNNA